MANTSPATGGTSSSTDSLVSRRELIIGATMFGLGIATNLLPFGNQTETPSQNHMYQGKILAEKNLLLLPCSNRYGQVGLYVATKNKIGNATINPESESFFQYPLIGTGLAVGALVGDIVKGRIINGKYVRGWTGPDLPLDADIHEYTFRLVYDGGVERLTVSSLRDNNKSRDISCLTLEPTVGKVVDTFQSTHRAHPGVLLNTAEKNSLLEMLRAQ